MSQTEYRRAEERDREYIDRLWDTTDIPKFPTFPPEIVAERDGEIIGFVAMRWNEERVLVEPMICPSIHVYVRLWFHLERKLKEIGITDYFFRVAPHHMVGYEHALMGAEVRGTIKALGYHKGFSWFQRSINGGKLCGSLPK